MKAAMAEVRRGQEGSLDACARSSRGSPSLRRPTPPSPRSGPRRPWCSAGGRYARERRSPGARVLTPATPSSIFPRGVHCLWYGFPPEGAYPRRNHGPPVGALSGWHRWCWVWPVRDSAAVRPFVDLFHENKPAQAGVPSHGTCACRLMVSGRGVGINKKGSGDAMDLRPI